MKRLYIASDHAGYLLKEKVKKEFSEIEWIDCGAPSEDSVDYSDSVQKLCSELLQNISSVEESLEPQGLLICGSGVGVSIAANRFAFLRAVLAMSPEIAEASRKHNASNLLCLGARFLEEKKQMEIIKVWLQSEFEGGRHLSRIKKIEVTK